MRFAFFASSLVSSYWNGAATYYRGIVRGLYDRGHTIDFYEPDAYGRQQHRDIDDPEWARVFVYEPERWRDALERAAGADVVVKASGVGANDAELEAGVLELGSPTTIFWDVDAPATLARVEHDPDEPFAELIPQYDLVLTYGGGDPVIARYRTVGARDCIPVYNALDPATHHPVPPQREFACDLAFLGNRLPDREARVDEFFLRAAALAREQRFLLGGAGWDDKPLPANVMYRGHTPVTLHNAVNCSALAVLNVTRQDMVDNGWSPPTRVFEAAGAGACLITDAWEGIEDFLEPATEVLVAESGGEVAELLRGLTPEQAHEVGAAARERLLAEHTYANRAAQVERILAGVRA
jgi:spore maturation protein CgeB